MGGNEFITTYYFPPQLGDELAQVRCGPDCVPVSLVIYIDGSFIKHGIPVKPIDA